MATAPFPHRYTVTLADSELAADARPPIRVGAPPQFGGTADVWSPEHLFVASALTCLKMTFDAYARREHIAVREWRGVATGVLAKGAGGPVFTSIDLDIAIVTDPGDEARAQSVLSSAERNCIVSRMLNVPVHVTGVVNAPPGRAAS